MSNEEFQSAVLSQLKILAEGQKKLEEGQDKLESRQARMEGDMCQLKGDMCQLKGDVQRIEKKLDAINDQTALLTEFKTAMGVVADDVQSIKGILGEQAVDIKTLKRIK